MKKRWVLLLNLMILFVLSANPDAFAGDWATDYEKSGFKETPRYKETMDYCRRLADASVQVTLSDFGLSPQGRKLPLLIIDKDGYSKPLEVKAAAKLVLLVEAGIHPGESCGKDAGLQLIRDIAIHGKYPGLLDKVTLLFIPIFNVDGHERFSPYHRINQTGPKEMGWRTTAQNLNLNRDFLKADAPEMQQWLKLFNDWLPDFLVDLHSTNGADYQYSVTYGTAKEVTMVEPLRKLTVERLQLFLDEKMEKSGFPMHFYIMFRDWHDIKSGMRTGWATPRYSTGYGEIQNRIFYLAEAHVLKTYKVRVDATYHLLSHILAFTNSNAAEIKRLNQLADRITAEKLTGDSLILDMKYSTKDSTYIDFAGVEYERIPSEISGAEQTIYYADRPKQYKMPFYHTLEVIDKIKVPYAYLIPKQWKLQVERLKLHGVKIQELSEDTEIRVSEYRLFNEKFSAEPYENCQMVTADVKENMVTQTFPAGTKVIVLNQRTNRVAVHLLEPKAPDSFLAWGFWNSIFQQKEYAEYYVMEKLARKMLKNDPVLAQEFEEKLKNDPEFAGNPRERLYFFFRRSKFWDQQKNLYPVCRVMEATDLPLLED